MFLDETNPKLSNIRVHSRPANTRYPASRQATRPPGARWTDMLILPAGPTEPKCFANFLLRKPGAGGEFRKFRDLSIGTLHYGAQSGLPRDS